MPTSAPKSVTTPVPGQVAELEFNPFILPHFLIPSFEAVLRDLKLATSSKGKKGKRKKRVQWGVPWGL
jgi:hypothetical protein